MAYPGLRLRLRDRLEKTRKSAPASPLIALHVFVVPLLFALLLVPPPGPTTPPPPGEPTFRGETLPRWVQQLDAKNADARAEAVTGVARLGIAADAAEWDRTADRLTPLLMDEDAGVRKAVIAGLARLALRSDTGEGTQRLSDPHIDAAVQGLRARLMDPREDRLLRYEALEALLQWGEPGAAALAKAAVELDPEPREFKRRAIVEAARMPAEVLHWKLYSKSAWQTPGGADQAIRQEFESLDHAMDPGTELDLVERAIRTRMHEWDRDPALAAVKRARALAAVVGPPLATLLTADDPQVQQDAVRAFYFLRTFPEAQAPEAMLAAVASEDEQTRWFAAVTLSRTAKNDADAEPAVAEIADQIAAQVRRVLEHDPNLRAADDVGTLDLLRTATFRSPRGEVVWNAVKDRLDPAGRERVEAMRGEVEGSARRDRR